MADDSVLAIHRSQDGVLWIGTDVGVSRYDGKDFVSFTTNDGLSDNCVAAIHSDSNGVMWFSIGLYAGGAGVSRYDGKEG